MSTRTNALDRKNTLLRYFTGGCLANVPLWILLLLSTFDVTIESWTAFAYVCVFVGTTIAGFLVPRKNDRALRAGLATAFSAYIVYVFSVTLIFGNVILFPAGDAGELLLLLDFASGGSIGSLIKKRYILTDTPTKTPVPLER